MGDCILQIYIVSNHASILAASAKVFSHLPIIILHGRLSVSRLSTWSWNPPRELLMQGVIAEVSESKRNTYWTTYLKKNRDTYSIAPSLISILDVLCCTVRAFKRFRTTVGQSSSAAHSTLPRYLKDINISRGSPYALNAIEFTYLASSAINSSCFQSAPFLHCAVSLCKPFRDRHESTLLA